MKKFLKENLHMVSKILCNHLGMMIFGLIVSLATSMLSIQFQNSVIKIVVGVFTALMYMFLLYTVMWEKGAADKVKIDGGRMEKNKLYGLYVSLYANSLFILLAILVIIFYLCGLTEATSFLALISSLVNGMYIIFTGMCPSWFVYIYLIVQLPSLIVCTISYILGVNGVKYIFPESKKQREQNLR
ncbi:MAG: hypothetical protein J6B60_04375 [Clostridia bacterium]|nr:hypothetical protein [Clostridia bacterium]